MPRVSTLYNDLDRNEKLSSNFDELIRGTKNNMKKYDTTQV